MRAWASFFIIFLCPQILLATQEYHIGVGIADITGPAAEVNMMGYADPTQTTKGIHTRLFSRAFIIGDQEGNRVVFVSVEAAMISRLVKQEVVKRLQVKYRTMYGDGNVCLSATHTHSGPGGFLDYMLYLVTSLGFIRQSWDALVTGIVKSIEKAHKSIQPGRILYARGELLGTSVNRSPSAYAKNPQEEKARYKYNVDKDMHLLKLTDVQGKGLGTINWFPVHCTSMNSSNRLITSDNKGYASLLFEQSLNPGSLPGKGRFVAAFAQSNEGDVSPNILGPHCSNTGLPCDNETSSCNGKSQLCVATGPGVDMFDSTRIIGLRQFVKARELFDSANVELEGVVQSRQEFVDMTAIDLELNGKKVNMCLPAMGHSFAAGTTDGPGAFSFTQGTRTGDTNAMWDFMRNFVLRPSNEQRTCHHPKPILLSTGEMRYPYPWQPTIVDTQIIRIGQLVIAAVPGEFTTMAGRRLVQALHEELSSGAKLTMKDPIVVIAGLSNIYTSYITTYEEYQEQRYEGASTIYGPYTLDAYLKQYRHLVRSLTLGERSASDAEPPNLLRRQISLLPGVIMDTALNGLRFGSVLRDVKSIYTAGSTVVALFICGHPRNNLQLDSSFLTVENYQTKSDRWKIVATDANWETRFMWHRISSLLGQSACLVRWDIPKDAPPGTYRLRHFGYRQSLFNRMKGYIGVSSSFKIIQTEVGNTE